MRIYSSLLPLAALSIMPVLSGCETKRLDQENFVLDTSRVPPDRFLQALAKRLGGSWHVIDVTAPSMDPNKLYSFKSANVRVVFMAMPHDRCNAKAPFHTTFDPAYRVDFVYRTTEVKQRTAAKAKLFQAAADVGERLTKFEECPLP